MSERMSQQVPEEPTIGRLVADITRDVTAVVHTEVELAKAELKGSAKAGGLGAALFLVAGFLGLMIIILLSIAFAYLLSMTGLHPAWCFMIVAGAYLLLAGVLVFVGITRMRKIRAPKQTIATSKQLPTALKGQSPSGSHRR